MAKTIALCGRPTHAGAWTGDYGRWISTALGALATQEQMSVS
ncbi:MAG TPA: hypothetical protein VGG18_04875 [Granulicella sp.]